MNHFVWRRQEERKQEAQNKNIQQIPSTTKNKEIQQISSTTKKDIQPKPELTEERRKEAENKKIQQIPKRELTEEEKLCKKLQKEARIKAKSRFCTGSLAVSPNSRNVVIANFSITFFRAQLLDDSMLELNCGQRYGLVGLRGCGKSTLMTVLGRREVPIPKHIDIVHLTREMPSSSKSALQCVMDVDGERIKLEKLAEELNLREDDDSLEQLIHVYERLNDMSANHAEAKAARILHGLGFDAAMQQKQAKDFSGGWRMRIALAHALFVKPRLLLLDDPLTHLDQHACVWLEEELRTYKRILVLTSHSQDFLNGVCSHIIHLTGKRLKYYPGNYESFRRTRNELLENQIKQYKWEQGQLAIARYGYGSAWLARQAQSKEKILAKMVAKGITERVSSYKLLDLSFPSCRKLPPPVIIVQHVQFRYSDDTPWIFSNLKFEIDLDTRLALVGPSGAGKSTLLKLLNGDLEPTIGMIRKNFRLRIGHYHQELHEMLEPDTTALAVMTRCFPDVKEEEMRKMFGRYGLSGRQLQKGPISQLSAGQKCRLIFAWLAKQNPHLLLLDEPTIHLDMEAIDALANAIRIFQGGMVLVSHDFRLISQVAEEIWVCEKGKVTQWKGSIQDYKEHVKNNIKNGMF